MSTVWDIYQTCVDTSWCIYQISVSGVVYLPNTCLRVGIFTNTCLRVRISTKQVSTSWYIYQTRVYELGYLQNSLQILKGAPNKLIHNLGQDQLRHVVVKLTFV